MISDRTNQTMTASSKTFATFSNVIDNLRIQLGEHDKWYLRNFKNNSNVCNPFRLVKWNAQIHFDYFLSVQYLQIFAQHLSCLNRNWLSVQAFRHNWNFLMSSISIISFKVDTLFKTNWTIINIRHHKFNVLGVVYDLWGEASGKRCPINLKN